MNIKELIHGVIEEIVEGRIRETDITDGSRVAVGSAEHVTDLEMRIADLERWRDRQRRGSAARDNYSRLISRLRGELRTANRIANPQAPVLDLGMDELDEGDGAKKKKKKKKQLTHVIPPTDQCGESVVREAVNMKDPEYSSVEVFVQYLLDEERDTFTHEELSALNFRTRMPVNAIRKELEGYGITLANRPNEKKVRGFSSNSNDRWFGPGSMATHGGSGIDPQTGRATSGRGDI